MKEKGFTLIELMVAVTILVIIGGTAYTAFNMALNVYQRETIRMVMNQNCRSALNYIVRDLNNMYIVEGDTELTFMAEDVPNEEEGDQDTITFVTVIDPRPDQFLAQLSGELEEQVEESEEETTGPKSDLIRVYYYLKTDEENFDESTLDYDEEPPLSLFRMTTNKLELEENESVGDILQGEESTSATTDEEEEGEYDEVAVADHLKSLDFKFSDGEEWYETWDDEERPPKAVQIIVSVTDEGGRELTVTQSTMVYLTLTANFSEEGEGEAQGGGPGGGPPGGGGGGQ